MVPLFNPPKYYSLGFLKIKILCKNIEVMEEVKKTLTYYQKNKSKYKKGGKYYKYVPKDCREPKIPIKINRGNFIISFN